MKPSKEISSVLRAASHLPTAKLRNRLLLSIRLKKSPSVVDISVISRQISVNTATQRTLWVSSISCMPISPLDLVQAILKLGYHGPKRGIFPWVAWRFHKLRGIPEVQH